jgi:hypothetical protein
MAKQMSVAKAKAKRVKVTAKQRVARKKNIEIARRAKKKAAPGKKKSTISEKYAKTATSGKVAMAMAAGKMAIKKGQQSLQGYALAGKYKKLSKAETRKVKDLTSTLNKDLKHQSNLDSLYKSLRKAGR